MTYKNGIALLILALLSACENSGEELYRAASGCNEKEVSALLSKEAISYRDEYGRTAAHRAATCRGDFSALRAIVDYAPDIVHSENNRHGTPLFSAFGPNDYQKVLFLLDRGSNIHQYDQDELGRYGLLERALTASPVETIRLLIERGAEVTPASFYKAIWYSNAETLALLLPKLDPGIVNSPDSLGHYPIETAINRGEIDILVILLEVGADTDIRFKNGKTPLEHAESKGENEMALVIEGLIERPM